MSTYALGDGGMSLPFNPQGLLQMLPWRIREKTLLDVWARLQESLWNICLVESELLPTKVCCVYSPPPKGSSHCNNSIPAALLNGGQKVELPIQRSLDWYGADLRLDVCKRGRVCLSWNLKLKTENYIRMRLFTCMVGGRDGRILLF